MFNKTEKQFSRQVSVRTFDVRRETWWFLHIIPLYSRDTIIRAY